MQAVSTDRDTDASVAARSVWTRGEMPRRGRTSFRSLRARGYPPTAPLAGPFFPPRCFWVSVARTPLLLDSYVDGWSPSRGGTAGP